MKKLNSLYFSQRAQELQIAQLAARRHTNKEIAAALSLAWAAVAYKTQVKIEGTRVAVQHLVEGKDRIKESAVLLDKNNKIVARWKPRTTNQWYKDYQDGWRYFRCFRQAPLKLKSTPRAPTLAKAAEPLAYTPRNGQILIIIPNF